MTFAEDGSREALKFHFLGSPDIPIGSWGHDYVRHLSLEVIEEYNHRSEKDENTDDLHALSLQMVPFLMQHNAEADACDLLIELETLDKLPQFVDKNTFNRVCLYLIR
jgi:26S proteasome regulatory subunit N1